MTLNRRQFVFGAAALGTLPAQTATSYSAEMPNMLLAYLAKRLDHQAQRWDAERAKIRTAADVLARNQFVRAKLREMAGRLPAAKPLAARTTRKLERKGYRIENVLIESQPDYWIPANLHVPTSGPGPFPAVVLQRGHFDAERMSPDYQQLHYDLVKSGFVVLTYDSIGQGERRQHYTTGTESFDALLSPTLEHCVIGGLLSLIGESAAGWFVSDGMRAIDYLAERSEVDRVKVGCADHTDTGWSTLLHCALDDRIRCASLHAHGNGRRWPIQTELWNTTDDPEQLLFPAANYGVDWPDTLAFLAPRPLQILVEDPGGDFNYTAAYVRERYRELDMADRIGIERARAGEDWPKTLRAATVRWFDRWLKGDTREFVESDLVPEPYSALNVTLEGSLRASKIGKPIYSLIRERASNLPPAQTPAQLKNDIRRMLRLPMDTPAPDARELSSARLFGYRLSTIEFLSEPGIYIPARLYRPERGQGDCIVYTTGDVTTFVPETDDDLGGPSPAKEDRDPSHEFAEGLARKGHIVLCIDVRGLGLTRPSANRRDLRGPYEHLHNSDVALANMAWSLGDSLFAMRVRDLLRAIDYASQFGRVRLAASEMGALWALFAAAVDTRVASVAIKDGLASYSLLTKHGRYAVATSQFLLGVLKQFDLPQVAGLIAPRPLTILDPTDHMKMPLAPVAAKQEYAWTERAYRTANAAGYFRILFNQELGEHAHG